MKRDTREPCVVVGAGPVGLTAALALRRLGVPVLVVEADPSNRVRPGSRAIGLMPPTLQRLEQVLPGLGQTIATVGGKLNGSYTYYNGRLLHQRGGPRYAERAGSPSRAGSPFDGGATMPQTVVEQILLKEAIAEGVQFRWNTPVAGLITDSAGVTLTSGEQFTAPYVIGADGAHSIVRKAIGAAMQGSIDDTPYIIADADEHPDGSTPGRVARFDYYAPGLDGRNAFSMPFAGGLRLDLQCLPTDGVEYLASPQGLREWIGKIVDPWYAEHIQWVSVYRFHQLVAESYTDSHHRVLLAGEAAHLFAPWGGRGLNSGIMDATDAATAIATALGVTDPADATRAIAGCAAERRAWGLHNRGIASRSLRILRGTDARVRFQRALAARLAPAFPQPENGWPAAT